MRVRVVRLSSFALEVVVTCDDAPWDRAAGVFSRRRDAERAAERARTPALLIVDDASEMPAEAWQVPAARKAAEDQAAMPLPPPPGGADE